MPALLSRESMTGSAELNRAAIYAGRLPIQQMFMLANKGRMRLVASNKIIIELKRIVRKLGKWRSKPGDAIPLEYAKLGQLLAQTAFKAVSDMLPADHATAFRATGAPLTVPDGADLAAIMRDDAVSWLNEFIALGVQHHLQDFEMLCISLLTTESFDWIIDEVAIEINTRLSLGFAPGGVAWSTKTADIPADLGAMRKDFIAAAGIAPDYIVYSYQLSEDLAKNTAIRDIKKRNNEAEPITDLPLYVLPADMRKATIIEHQDNYDSAALVSTAMWPHYIVTMAYLGIDPKNVMEALTVPTEADMGKGGLWSASHKDPLNFNTTAAVGFNAAAVTVDTKRIMSWDVSTTS